MARIAAVLLGIAAVALILSVSPAWATDEGPTLYQAKCAACHGVDGAGKPAAGIPSLISETVRRATDAQLNEGIANGGATKRAAHSFQARGLSPDQIHMIVSYIRELQKK